MIESLAALLLLSAAQPGEPEPSCTQSTAVATTVRSIAEAPERWVGRCVTVSGPAGGTTIYSGIEGVNLAHRGTGGHADGGAASLHRLGLYSRDNEIRSRYARSPLAHLTVTGIVDTCGRMQARAEAETAADGQAALVTMGGFCHWSAGPVIRVASWRADSSRRYERLSGERARRRFGTYAPMPANWRHRLALESFARDFLRALRTGDRPALASLHGEEPPADGGGTLLTALLHDTRAGWADVRRQSSPQTAIFVPMAPQSHAVAAAHAEPAGLVCFCRSVDCSQTWPINWGDADNAPERPYVCTFVSPAEWVARRAVLDTPQRSAWLAEPAKSAFRR